MLSKTLLVVLVLGALIVDDCCQAWRLFRRIRRFIRRVGRKVKDTVKGVGRTLCRTACPKVCDLSVCRVVCNRICQRSIPDFLNNPNFKVVPMSSDFNHYDLNKNKYITVEEFSRAERVPKEDVRRVYEFADFDQDGKLDHDEFITAPLVFSAQVAEELNRIRANQMQAIANGETPTANITSNQLVSTAA